MNSKHLAVIGGVIGAVLMAHKATAAQTIAAVSVGVGAYTLIRNKKKDEKKP